jgi:hypothetical protein
MEITSDKVKYFESCLDKKWKELDFVVQHRYFEQITPLFFSIRYFRKKISELTTIKY